MSAPAPFDRGPFDREAVMAAVRPQIEAIAASAAGAINRLKRLPLFAFGGAIAGFVIFSFIGLGGLGGFLGFLAGAAVMFREVFQLFAPLMRARAEALRIAAPHLGLDYAFKPAERIDFSPFVGTALHVPLEYAHAENVLSGRRGEARFQLFDLVTRPGKFKPGPEAPGGMSFPFLFVVRVEIEGRWTAKTVIARDYGLANRLTKPKGLDPVRLVDPEFERLFEAWSSDQTEARALLNPLFMERLKALEDRFHPKAKGENTPMPALAVFQNGAFLLGLPSYQQTTGEDDAAPDLAAKIDAAKIAEIAIERLVDDLASLMGVVDALLGRPSP